MAIPVVEQKLCLGCGECVDVCEANAIRIIGEKARINYLKCYNHDKSNKSNCSACAQACPRDAIKLVD